LAKGTVRWFSNAYGYGFIQDDRGKEIFVHYSVILQSGYKSLKDGQEVEFEMAVGPKGEHATMVIPQAGVDGALPRIEPTNESYPQASA
jgi:CspA family cold shock protein